jgi:hypothetical protein
VAQRDHPARRFSGLCAGVPAEDYTCSTRGLDGAAIRQHYEKGSPERILDLTLRTGPFGDRYGENPDALTPEKTNVPSPPYFIDEPSGNGALNGIPVTVSAIETHLKDTESNGVQPFHRS